MICYVFFSVFLQTSSFTVNFPVTKDNQMVRVTEQWNRLPSLWGLLLWRYSRLTWMPVCGSNCKESALAEGLDSVMS